jgi:hypothetical protein
LKNDEIQIDFVILEVYQNRNFTPEEKKFFLFCSSYKSSMYDESHDYLNIFLCVGAFHGTFNGGDLLLILQLA